MQTQDPSPPAGKRRRIAVACKSCRSRKSKCDGHRPSCATCLSLDLDCQYDAPDSSSNVVVRNDYLVDLHSRTETLERTVRRLDHLLTGHLSGCVGLPDRHPEENARLVESPAQARNPDGDSLPESSLENSQDAGASTDGMAMIFVEEHNAAFFGESSNIEFIRLLLRIMVKIRRSSVESQSTTAEEYTTIIRDLASSSSQWPVPKLPPSTSYKQLPSIKEMDAMLDTYFDTTGLLFPFIDEERLRATYAECTSDRFRQCRRSWLGILNMIFAMACNFNQDGNVLANERFQKSRVFYQRASALCDEASNHTVSLEIVQYLLLVNLYLQGTQQSIQAWNRFGILVRSAMSIGLHVDRTRDVTTTDEDSRRRTWMAIYCLDKVLSMTFGRPAAIVDELMVNFQSTRPTHSSRPLARPTDTSSSETSFVQLSSQLYQIMGQSLVKQYGANMCRVDVKHDEMTSLQTCGELREILREWELNLPHDFALCKPDSDILSQNTRFNRLRVILTLRYHNVAILIRRPLLSSTLRSLFFGQEHSSGGNPSYLVNLVMAEAHECFCSARSTIEIVHTVLMADSTNNNNLGVWFFNLYYVFSASLIVCSRLMWAQHGEEDEATVNQSNLLLQKAETIFKKLDQGNSLISSCAQYIRKFSSLSSSLNTQNPESHAFPHSRRPSNVRRVSNKIGSSNQALDIVDSCAADSEVLHFLDSNIFDPCLFEGFLIDSDSVGFTDF